MNSQKKTVSWVGGMITLAGAIALVSWSTISAGGNQPVVLREICVRPSDRVDIANKRTQCDEVTAIGYRAGIIRPLNPNDFGGNPPFNACIQDSPDGPQIEPWVCVGIGGCDPASGMCE